MKYTIEQQKEIVRLFSELPSQVSNYSTTYHNSYLNTKCEARISIEFEETSIGGILKVEFNPINNSEEDKYNTYGFTLKMDFEEDIYFSEGYRFIDCYGDDLHGEYRGYKYEKDDLLSLFNKILNEDNGSKKFFQYIESVYPYIKSIHSGG